MINDYPHLDLLQNICKKVKECGATSVHVAGGAVRDSILGKPIKDIDVFYEGELNNQKVLQHFTHHPVEWPDNILAYESNENWQVKYAKMSMEICDYPIQLIRVLDFPKHVDTFAAGISKCWVDEAGLHLSTSFLNNAYFKTIAFSEDSEYTDRVKDKYQDYDYTGAQCEEGAF